MKFNLKNIISLIFLFLVNAELWSQCAMCRAVLESGEGENMAKGINNGITYLMIIPYILVIIVGYQVFKKRKK